MRMSYFRLLWFLLTGLAIFTLLMGLPFYGQERVQVARADGLRIPLPVYRAAGAAAGVARAAFAILHPTPSPGRLDFP